MCTRAEVQTLATGCGSPFLGSRRLPKASLHTGGPLSGPPPLDTSENY